MKKKKPSLLCTEKGLRSKSLREIARGLSAMLGKRIWRTTKPSLIRPQFRYGQSVNKLSQYQWFTDNDIPCLEFTTELNEAIGWCEDGHTVFGRKYLNASCGKGIMVFETPDDIEPCPVYTKYKKKKREFRVHVFKDQVVSVVEKKRKKEFDGERDTKIRNVANGYVFVQQNVDEPDGLRELALRAAEVSYSDFRGVDIGYNKLKDELFVIEVNSAPGIQGNNINRYLEAIVQYV
ncbi:ATP-grasp fold, RimK-type [uncultured Caudovirales phage]|uniref:ATP-grasp fold, RimK-type n=1 Tax=uncultured Caudovirales phage TaxID=2100421 RepID=A0A6J5LEK9_9CAUD|nr:ATP-grasp fold, RimK-type [uncultured Caudovirales phage]